MLNIDSMPPAPAFVVVDARCRIRYVSSEGASREEDLKWILASRHKLQADVESFVRCIAEEAGSGSSVRVGVMRENRLLRAARVVGGDGAMFILSVEDDRNSNSLLRAARRHQLTRRETEVLSLILDGASAGEIAEMLALSEHTVQGYFKRLLFKTGARNRVSMVASIFDWDAHRQGARPIGATLDERERMSGALSA